MRIAFLEQYLTQQRLRNIELLSSLSEDDLRAIAHKLDFKSFTRGEIIVEAGTPGNAVYFIEDGQARLVAGSSEGESFEELNEGALFGHTALITGKPYPATIRAMSDVSVWFLARSTYLDLVREHPAIKLAFSRALAETLGPSDQNEAADRIRLLPLFSDVPTEALSALVARLVLRHFPVGDIIYTEGTPGDALYIVEAGEVKLMDSAFSDAQLLERMHSGESFGEMALLTGRTRAECARAASDTTVWVLYKSDYDDLMVQYPEISVSLSRALTERLASREDDFLLRHLRRINLFSNLATSELKAISKKVKGLRFRSGEIICFAGHAAQTLFMIEMGEIKRVGVGPRGEPVMIDLLGPGDSFGEQAIIQNSAYPSTAQAIGEVELWTISKSDFMAMMEQYPTLAMTVTRLMADRLSRTQTMPAPRGTAPQQRPGTSGPRAAPPRPGQARSAPPPRPTSSTPPSRSRIQQPPSGARPIPRPAPPKPPQKTDHASTVVLPAVQPTHPIIVQPTPTVTRPQPQITRRPAPKVAPPAPTSPLTPLPPSPSPGAELRARRGGRGLGDGGEAPRVQRRAPNQFLNELVMWLNGLSWGARFRATALTGLFVWFAFIALPATAITTVTSAVGGLQIFNAAPTQSGTSAPNIPAALTRTSSGPKSKVAYAVASETPVPTKTRIPPTATRRPPTAVPATRVPPTAAPVAAILAPAATPLPAAPPVAAASIDSRLGPSGLERLQNVRIEPAGGLARGQKYWHITQIGFENGPKEQTSGCGDYNIKVNVVDENGKRIFGKKLKITGGDPSPEYPVEKTQADAENACGFNFSKETGGGEYTARIEDPENPSDVAAGLQGLPMKQHVSYLITFQLTTNP